MNWRATRAPERKWRRQSSPNACRSPERDRSINASSEAAGFEPSVRFIPLIHSRVFLDSARWDEGALVPSPKETDEAVYYDAGSTGNSAPCSGGMQVLELRGQPCRVDMVDEWA